MLSLIRIALQVLLFFLLLSVIVGFASPDTGVGEKMVLVGLGGVLIWLAVLVRRLGAVPRST